MNAERYLLIKQLLFCLKITKENKRVKFQNKEYDSEALIELIKELIVLVRQDFELPHDVFNNRLYDFNFESLVNDVLLIKTNKVDDSYGEVDYQEIILEYPEVFNLLKYCYSEKSYTLEDQQKLIGDLSVIADNVLSYVNSMEVETVDIRKAIESINLTQVIESIFDQLGYLYGKQIESNNPTDGEHLIEETVAEIEAFESRLFTPNQITVVLGSEGLAISGNEGFWESFGSTTKKFIEQVRINMKKIVEFFMGDGKEQLENAYVGAKESVTALSKKDQNIPIDSNNPIRDPNKYMKPLKGDEDGESNTKEAESIKNALSALQKDLEGVKNAETIGDLIKVFNTLVETAKKGGETCTSLIEHAAKNVEDKANKLASVKPASEDDPKEVADTKKEEAKTQTSDLKDSSKETEKISKLRSKFVSVLIYVKKYADVAGNLNPPSSFKG